MPVYDYECGSCGVFTALLPMSRSAEPCDCPECGARSERVFLSMPAFAAMDHALRTAHATNERSRHAPRSSKMLGGHGPDCGCCGTGKKSGFTATAADGAKSFPKARPWMISH